MIYSQCGKISLENSINEIKAKLAKKKLFQPQKVSEFRLSLYFLSKVNRMEFIFIEFVHFHSSNVINTTFDEHSSMFCTYHFSIKNDAITNSMRQIKSNENQKFSYERLKPYSNHLLVNPLQFHRNENRHCFHSELELPRNAKAVFNKC